MKKENDERKNEEVTFGHLHEEHTKKDYDIGVGNPHIVDGVRYFLASADYLDFKPLLVTEVK